MEETKKTFKDWMDSPERIKMAEEIERHRKQREMEVDYWWNNELTEAEREKAFYAVVKRIHKAEIQDRGSYRWALYDVFKFDMVCTAKVWSVVIWICITIFSMVLNLIIF